MNEQDFNVMKTFSVKEKIVYSFEDLKKESAKPTEFLVKNLIPKNNYTVFFAEDGMGKTRIMSQLCLSVATKQSKFMNLELKYETANVLFVSTEESSKNFGQALVKQYEGIESRMLGDLRFLDASHFDKYEDLMTQVNALQTEFHFDLVVVDSFVDLVTSYVDGDINSTKDVNATIAPWKKLSLVSTVVFIHHASKSKVDAKRKRGEMFLEKNDQIGSGRITGSPRTVLCMSAGNLAKQGQRRYLHVTKCNIMTDYFRRNAIELDFDNETLLFEAKAIVNIREAEAALLGAPAGKGNKPDDEKPKNPFALDHGDKAVKTILSELKMKPMSYHAELLRWVFNGTDEVLGYSEMTDNMVELYRISARYVREKDGLKDYLLALGYIEHVPGARGKYKLGSKMNEIFSKDEEMF